MIFININMDPADQKTDNDDGFEQVISVRKLKQPVIELSLKHNITVKTLLPDEWIVYIYDQRMAVKFSKNPDFKHNALLYPVICKLTTVEEILWFILLMKQNNALKDPIRIDSGYTKNIDMFTFVVMRSHIAPIWEDKHNKNGGTWTVVTKQNKGYDIWRMILMNLVGEVLTADCTPYINGISYSYISKSERNQNVNDSSYIKIWDGNPLRTKAEELTSLLPRTIFDMLKDTSIQYKKNTDRNDFGNQRVSSKFEDTINKSKSHYTNNRGRR